MAAPSNAHAVCPEPIQARIDFLEERLDARRNYARNWWRLWTTVYAAGVVFQGASIGFEDDEGERADLIVGTVKSIFGTARLWTERPNARLGADTMRAIPPDDANACERRLAVGEEMLRINAEESHNRWSWKRHLGNVAVNTIGGVIVTEGFDEDSGWESMGIGIAVGALQIFSSPAGGDDDLEEYERRFSPPTAAKPSWNVAARFSDGIGLQLQVRY